VVEIQGNLDSIKSCLEVVHDLVAMETSSLMVKKSDVLADILMVVGLNRRRILRLDNQLQALKEVARYRTAAARYLAGIFSGLAQLQEATELLRSLTTGVSLVEGVLMEVLINALTVGIQRLRCAGRFGPTLETGYDKGRLLLVSNS